MAEHIDESTRQTEQATRNAQDAAYEVFRSSVDLFRRTVERTVDLQDQMLDAAARQNSEAADLWKRLFATVPGAEPMFNLAEQTVGQFIETQKRILSVVNEQSKRFAESSKSQGEQTMHTVQRATEWPEGGRTGEAA